MLDELVNTQTPESIATTVAALRQEQPDKIVVLLEGNSDYLFFKKFLAHPSTYQHLVCRGKPTLISASEILESRATSRILAICDADYDRILENPVPAHVLMTDLHDAEMLVCMTDAIDRVILERLHLDGHTGVSLLTRIRNSALEAAQIIGKIRIENQRLGERLTFKRVDAGAFVQVDWRFDIDAYIQALLDVSESATLTIQEIRHFGSERNLSTVPKEDLVNGHDLASLLDAYLSIPFGLEGEGREKLESSMRLALSRDEFEQAQLREHIRQWEVRHRVSVLY
jgi:hypothetical protein